MDRVSNLSQVMAVFTCSSYLCKNSLTLVEAAIVRFHSNFDPELNYSPDHLLVSVLDRALGLVSIIIINEGKYFDRITGSDSGGQSPLLTSRSFDDSVIRWERYRIIEGSVYEHVSLRVTIKNCNCEIVVRFSHRVPRSTYSMLC